MCDVLPSPETWMNKEAILTTAAGRGHLEVVRWLALEQGLAFVWQEDIFNAAVRHGRLDLLKWMRFECNPACPWNLNSGINAAACGHINVLKWLLIECNPPCPSSEVLFYYAAINGHAHVLRWLVKNNVPVPVLDDDDLRRLCIRCAEAGHVDVLRWLHRERVPAASLEQGLWTAAMYAPVNKVEPFLEYLYSVQCPHDACFVKQNFFSRYSNRSVENDERVIVLTLRWICRRQYPYGDASMLARGACTSGFIDVLDVLHDEWQYPWTVDDLLDAIDSKHLAVVQWFEKKGCLFDQDVRVQRAIACNSSHYDLFTWFHARRCKQSKMLR